MKKRQLFKQIIGGKVLTLDQYLNCSLRECTNLGRFGKNRYIFGNRLTEF